MNRKSVAMIVSFAIVGLVLAATTVGCGGPLAEGAQEIWSADYDSEECRSARMSCTFTDDSICIAKAMFPNCFVH